MKKKITLYTMKSCSKCMMLKKILDTKDIEYNTEDNMTVVREKATQEGISEMPILTIIEEGKDGSELVFSGSEAVIYGKEM